MPLVGVRRAVMCDVDPRAPRLKLSVKQSACTLYGAALQFYSSMGMEYGWRWTNMDHSDGPSMWHVLPYTQPVDLCIFCVF